MIEQHFVDLIAGEVHVKPEQAAAAIACFDRGAAVPFVARYRKDVTGGLSENKLERIAERNEYFIALTARRGALLENIEKQGRLSDELRAAFVSCDDHLRLEDMSLPYKKQRNNRAAIAATKGLLPLADYIWAQSPVSPPPHLYAASFVGPDKQVLSEEEALEGARHILAECIAMNADIRQTMRRRLMEEGVIVAAAVKTPGERAARYKGLADFKEKLHAIHDEKLLLILRGERDAALRIELTIDDEQLMEDIARRFIRDPESAYAQEIRGAVSDAYKRLLRPAIEAEVFAGARRRADEAMVALCREQVRNLLMTAPAGDIPVVGVYHWSAHKR